MADDTIGELIDSTATVPAETTIDGSTVKEQPLPDLIAADRYRKGQSALAGGLSAWGATRPARLVPPGTGDRSTESA